LIYSNRTLKYFNGEVELKTKNAKIFFISVGIEPWPETPKAPALTKHQYQPMSKNFYFTAL